MEYELSDRQVFEYHDGKERVFGDPLKLQRELTLELADPAKVVSAINAADASDAEPIIVLQGWRAAEELIQASYKVFQLVPFDRKTNTGATEAHALAVVHNFWAWLDQKKTPAASSPT